jgi:hypothetical protein
MRRQIFYLLDVETRDPAFVNRGSDRRTDQVQSIPIPSEPLRGFFVEPSSNQTKPIFARRSRANLLYRTCQKQTRDLSRQTSGRIHYFTRYSNVYVRPPAVTSPGESAFVLYALQ